MKAKIYTGDNLQVLKEKINDESIDIVYLDPPFNSKQIYKMLYGGKGKSNKSFNENAFSDSWKWDDTLLDSIQIFKNSSSNVYKTIKALHSLPGSSGIMAYLIFMALRLVEIRRVLKLNQRPLHPIFVDKPSE